MIVGEENIQKDILEKNIFDHIFYEFEMYFNTFYELIAENGKIEDPIRHNLLIESHNIHLRNIMEFFTLETGSITVQDVLDIDIDFQFIDYSKEKQSINKTINHLTHERYKWVGGPKDLKNKNSEAILKLYKPVASRIKLFLELLTDKSIIAKQYRDGIKDERIADRLNNLRTTVSLERRFEGNKKSKNKESERILKSCEAFCNAEEYLNASMVLIKPQTMHSLSAATLATFSCELFLKAILIYYECLDVKKDGHSLKKLFQRLPSETQEYIKLRVYLENWDEFINAANNAFCKFRYTHENIDDLSMEILTSNYIEFAKASREYYKTYIWDDEQICKARDSYYK